MLYAQDVFQCAEPQIKLCYHLDLFHLQEVKLSTDSSLTTIIQPFTIFSPNTLEFHPHFVLLSSN